MNRWYSLHFKIQLPWAFLLLLVNGSAFWLCVGDSQIHFFLSYIRYLCKVEWKKKIRFFTHKVKSYQFLVNERQSPLDLVKHLNYMMMYISIIYSYYIKIFQRGHLFKKLLFIKCLLCTKHTALIKHAHTYKHTYIHTSLILL